MAIVLMINILLVGLGPHARRIQFPIILKDGKQYNAQIKSVIDLASQEALIRDYLEAKNFKEPIEFIFLDKQKSRIDHDQLHPALVAQLDALIKRLFLVVASWRFETREIEE